MVLHLRRVIIPSAFTVGMDSLTLSYQQMVSCLFNTTLQ